MMTKTTPSTKKTGEMYVKSTYFMDFRGLQPQRASWSQGLNLIIGPNGAGKTNILEGLSMVCGWGPLERGTKISSLITWNEPRASLWAGASGEESVEIFLSIGKRCTIKIDDRAARSARVRSTVPVIPFLSDHISIVKGSSSFRRGVLDRVGAIVMHRYAKVVSDHRRLLRQKTVMLRKGYETSYADRALIPLGAWIWRAREEILRSIVRGMERFKDMLPGEVELSYKKGGDRSGCGDIADLISRSAAAERASRVPLVGPQRDDILIKCDGRDAATFLSRGQCRKISTAIVLASACAVEEALARKPILVFDEIASELDEGGREQTFDALVSTGCQVFASSTDEYDSSSVSTKKVKEGRFV